MAAQIPLSSSIVGTRESQLTISPVSATFPSSSSPAPDLVPPTPPYSPFPTPLPLPAQAHFISPSNSPAPLLGYHQNGAPVGTTTKSPSAQAAIDTYNRLKVGFGRPPWSQGTPQVPFSPPPPMPHQVASTYPNGAVNQYPPPNQLMYYPQMANNTVAPNPPLLPPYTNSSKLTPHSDLSPILTGLVKQNCINERRIGSYLELLSWDLY